LTPACAGLLEPKGSGLKLLKSTFNAENFIRRLSWSISTILVQFTLEVRVQPEIAKNSLNPYFRGLRSFKVIDVDISEKLVASACYDKQHVSAYLQPFSR